MYKVNIALIKETYGLCFWGAGGLKSHGWWGGAAE